MMNYPVLCLLALLSVPASAAPVHIALKLTAIAQPDGDGFLRLASVADLTGGDKAARTRLSDVRVARAPLSGERRRLTRGDLALKLRQAGCNPDTQVVFEGAQQADVTVGDAPNSVGALLAAPLPLAASPGLPTSNADPASVNTGAASSAPAAPLIHRGDAITIYIQSGLLTITAPGIARENGGAGDTIRVHRAGVMTDLSVQVLDTQTVRLEI